MARTSKVYWADGGAGNIRRMNPDGTNSEIIVSGLTTPADCVVDPTGEKIYYSTIGGTKKIAKANLDGTSQEDLVTTGLGTPIGLDLHLPSGFIFWCDSAGSYVYRSKLDGTEVTRMYSREYPNGIKIVNDTVYFTTDGSHKTCRMDINIPSGYTYSNREDVEEVMGDLIDRVTDISFDSISNKIYYIDDLKGALRRCDPDGSNNERMFDTHLKYTSDSRVTRMAVDPSGGKIFWGDSDKGVLRRANLDGTNVENMITGYYAAGVWPITLDIPNQKIYWIPQTRRSICRADMSGINSNLEVLAYHYTHLDNSYGLGLDTINGKMYWGDYSASKLFRCNIEIPSGEAYNARSDIEIVVGVVAEDPRAVTLDLANNKIYWVDTGMEMIRRSDLDGSNIETVVTSGISGPEKIAIDTSGSKIYWTDTDLDSIRRANLDGTNPEILITGQSNPQGLVLDVPNDRMYWGESISQQIRYSNLDGTSGVTALLSTGIYEIRGLTLDSSAGQLYFSDSEEDDIGRFSTAIPSGYTASTRRDVERMLFDVMDNPRGCAVDAPSGKIYWCNYNNKTIMRADLNGQSAEALINKNLHTPGHIALDLVNRKMYWAEYVANEIWRANMEIPSGETSYNRTDMELLVSSASGVDYPMRIAVDPSGQKLYWTEYDDDQIVRSNLDGTNVEVLQSSSTAFNYPYGICVDPSGSKVYFSAIDKDYVWRMDSSGTNREAIVDKLLDYPNYMAIDEASGHIYWGDTETAKIMRSDLNGSGVTEIVTVDLFMPLGVALDLNTRKIYWCEGTLNQIMRADIDGRNSNIEVVVPTASGINYAIGIAVDSSGGKIYWADYNSDLIKRANLDGTTVEDVVTGQDKVVDVAINASGDKIYWVKQATGGETVSRADASGLNSNIEHLVTTGLTSPVGITYVNDVVYFTDYGTDKIESIDPSGGNRTTIIDTDLNQACGLAVHIASGLLFWADREDEVLERATTSGTNRTTIISAPTKPLTNPVELFMDSSGTKLYIGDDSYDKIFKCDPDGSNFEEVVSTANPAYVDIDSTNNKIYITNYSTTPYNIRRMDIDGSNEEIVIKWGDTIPRTTSVRDVELDVSGNKMYFMDTALRALSRSDLDGNNVQQLVAQKMVYPYGMSIDASGGKIYWVDYTDNCVMRSNLDGSVAEILVYNDQLTPNIAEPISCAVDPSGGKIYWLELTTDRICRANLDGSYPEILLTTASGLSDARGIVFSPSNQKIYWVDNGTNKLHRANLDGSSVEDVLTGLNTPLDLAIHPTSGLLFWTDYGSDKLQSCDLNGSGLNDLATSLDNPRGVAVDTENNKVYWGENGNVVKKISRCNLDGSSSEIILDGDIGSVIALGFEPSGDKIYFFDVGIHSQDQRLRRMNLDGSGVEIISTQFMFEPYDIALDIPNNKLYWADEVNDQIGRANLDGSSPEILIISRHYTENPNEILIDPSGNYIYWADTNFNNKYRIMRYDINTSGITSIVQAPGQQYYGLAIDTSGGKIYFSAQETDAICRSNLNGSGIEILVHQDENGANIDNPQCITLDVVNNRMYWAEYDSNDIRRANLDGSDLETIIQSNNPAGISLDLTNQKIYWTEYASPYRLRRSNLDGSSPETILESLPSNMRPWAVAVDAPNNKIYWSDDYNDKLKYCDLSGSGITDLFATTGDYKYLYLDTSGGKLYWSDRSDGRNIGRCDLNGSGYEILLDYDLVSPLAICGDPINGYLYFSDSYNANEPHLRPGNLRKMDLNIPSGESNTTRSDITMIINPNIIEPSQFDIDWSGNKIYFGDYDNGIVARSNSDGSNIETLLFGLPTEYAQPDAPDYDPITNKLYFAGTSNNYTIRRFSPGSSSGDIQAEYVVGRAYIGPNNMAIDRVNNKIYWTDGSTDNLKVQRCNLDGSDVEDIIGRYITPQYTLGPRGIALDPENNKMYWADIGTDKIYQADLDGSGIEVLVPYIADVDDMAIDYATRKLYWVNDAEDKIHSVHLDTRVLERDLISQPGTNPSDIAIDSSGGRMFWQRAGIWSGYLDGTGEQQIFSDADCSQFDLDLINSKIYYNCYKAAPDGEIRSRNFDGTNQQTIISGIAYPWHITIDQSGEKIYWRNQIDGTHFQLMRADLNGSNQEVVLETIDMQPYGLSIDTSNRQLYWTDYDRDEILRSDMDGDNRELLFNSASSPRGLYADMLPRHSAFTSLFIHGHIATTSGIALTETGHSLLSSGTNLFVVGPIPYSGSTTLLIHGHLPLSSGMTLVEAGHKIASGDMNLYSKGPIPDNGSVILVSEGHEALSSGTTLFAEGSQIVTDNITLFNHGHWPKTSGTILAIWGYDTSLSGMTLYASGLGVATASTVLTIEGHEEIPDGISLFIEGETLVFEKILDQFLKTADYDPQAIGSFDDGAITSVTIEVWDLMGGANTVITLLDNTCYAIGNTGRWGWSTANLPEPYVHEGQFLFRMTTNTSATFEGEFFLASPEEGKWRHPDSQSDFIL